MQCLLYRQVAPNPPKPTEPVTKKEGLLYASRYDSNNPVNFIRSLRPMVMIKYKIDREYPGRSGPKAALFDTGAAISVIKIKCSEEYLGQNQLDWTSEYGKRIWDIFKDLHDIDYLGYIGWLKNLGTVTSVPIELPVAIIKCKIYDYYNDLCHEKSIELPCGLLRITEQPDAEKKKVKFKHKEAMGIGDIIISISGLIKTDDIVQRIVYPSTKVVQNKKMELENPFTRVIIERRSEGVKPYYYMYLEKEDD